MAAIIKLSQKNEWAESKMSSRWMQIKIAAIHVDLKE